MLRIRLRRVGKKGNPSYRIVVADSRAPRDGAFVEWIGNYDPMTEPPTATIKADRAQAWLSQGAQPSDAVARILDWNGILTRTPTQRAATRAADEAPAATAAAPAPAAATPAAESEADGTSTVAEDTSEEAVAEVASEETTAEAAAEEGPEEPANEDESGGDDATGASEEESS